MPNLFPVQERETYIVKEAVPGTAPATVGVPVPVLTCKPSDKPLMLPDESMQGHMGDNSGIYQGPLIAGIDLGGHVTMDILGHLLYNLLGDYTSAGTVVAPTATTNGVTPAGQLFLTVVSGGAAFTAGMFVNILDTGSPAATETVTIGAGSTATNVVLTTPTRFAHATATVINNTTGPYTHSFSLLNGLIGAGPNGAAQPWTHTITDRTGIPATGLAAQYSYLCLSDLTITGNSEKLLDWSAKGVCQTRTIPGAPVTAFTAVSAALPQPSWRSTAALGAPVATLTKDVAEWAVTFGRAVKPYNTTQGSQLPYAIARGKQTTSGKVVILPAVDETAVIALLANTQPQAEYICSNGLTALLAGSLTIDVGLTAYETADLNEGGELFGYDVPWKAAHTAATFTTTPFTGPLTGASGGKSAAKITLVNQVPSY